MRFKGFIGPAYTLDSLNMESQQCINMYPIVDEQGTGKEGEVSYLRATPGLIQGHTVSGGITSEYTASNGQLFISTATTLYKVNNNETTSVVGTGIIGTNPIYDMTDNGTQLILVTGSRGYIYNLTTGVFSQISSVGFLGSDYSVLFDNYVILNKPETNILYLSSLGDASSYDPLDAFSVDATPDKILRHINLHRELWIFKVNTIDVYYNTGNLGTPFQREAGIFIEKGCISGRSVIKLNNTVLWVGSGKDGFGIVYVAAGYEPQRVSNFHVERLIRLELSPSTIICWGYESGGHVFYNIRLSSTTLSFDLTTGMWHERKSSNPSTGAQSTYEVFMATPYNGRTVVASSTRFFTYYLDESTYTDAGNPIERIRSSPHVSGGLKKVIHRSIQLDLESGNGSGNIYLETSDNDGRSWVSRIISIGSLGQYRRRIKLYKLGLSRNRVYRVRFTDPLPFSLIGAELDVEGTNA